MLDSKKIYNKNYYILNKDKLKKYSLDYYKNNPISRQASVKKYYNSLSLEKKLWNGAKDRANRKNLEFNITVDDIYIPEYCPIFNTKLDLHNHSTKGGYVSNSPSLDRIDNTKGYIKDNIRIISHRANSAKSNLTLTEILQLLADKLDWFQKRYSK